MLAAITGSNPATLLGHSGLNMTLTYTRKRMEGLERAMEGLEFT